jgi:hypothetical protein
MAKRAISESHRLCSELRPSELCIVVEQCRDGLIERPFHQHIPETRLSTEAKIDLLRSLVALWSGWSGLSTEQIMRTYLNTRSKQPAASGAPRIMTSYPEPGAMRYCCGADTKAWIDVVIEPVQFRKRRDDVGGASRPASPHAPSIEVRRRALSR